MGRPYKGSPAAAIDFAADGGTGEAGLVRMRDAAKWFYDKFADLTVELIHSTPFKDDRGFYVKNQVRYPGGGPYDAATRREHLNHVHFATSEALARQILARLETKEGPLGSGQPQPAGITPRRHGCALVPRPASRRSSPLLRGELERGGARLASPAPRHG